MRSLLTRLGLIAFPIIAGGLLAGCGGSSYSAPTAPGGGSSGGGTASVTITILGMNGGQSFSPNPGSVKVGQTVAWKNNDAITHTATADSGSFDTGAIPPGGTSNPITMSTAGTFGYHCSIHPTMTGTLTVTQ
jgi:plastocyanin